MRVLDPIGDVDPGLDELAPRPHSLVGKVIGFLDGWGQRTEDGRFEMYSLMEEFKNILTERMGIADTLWFKKPSVTVPAAKEVIEELLKKADVVINGESL